MKHLIATLLLAVAAPALADMAPPPPMTKDQIRRGRGIDSCKTLKHGDACRDMQGLDGHCDWFVWWWKPDSNERGFDKGKEDYAGYETTCQTIQKIVTDAHGKALTVQAFKCLICM